VSNDEQVIRDLRLRKRM